MGLKMSTFCSNNQGKPPSPKRTSGCLDASPKTSEYNAITTNEESTHKQVVSNTTVSPPSQIPPLVIQIQRTKHTFTSLMDEIGKIDVMADAPPVLGAAYFNEYIGNPGIINDFDQTRFLHLVSKGDYSTIQHALQLGADPNLPGIWRDKDKAQQTKVYPLERAADGGDEKLVQLLLDYKATLQKNISANDMLQAAIWPSHSLGIARIALMLGANITPETLWLIKHRWHYEHSPGKAPNSTMIDIWHLLYRHNISIGKMAVTRHDDPKYDMTFEEFVHDPRIMGYGETTSNLTLGGVFQQHVAEARRLVQQHKSDPSKTTMTDGAIADLTEITRTGTFPGINSDVTYSNVLGALEDLAPLPLNPHFSMFDLDPNRDWTPVRIEMLAWLYNVLTTHAAQSDPLEFHWKLTGQVWTISKITVKNESQYILFYNHRMFILYSEPKEWIVICQQVVKRSVIKNNISHLVIGRRRGWQNYRPLNDRMYDMWMYIQDHNTEIDKKIVDIVWSVKEGPNPIVMFLSRVSVTLPQGLLHMEFSGDRVMISHKDEVFFFGWSEHDIPKPSTLSMILGEDSEQVGKSQQFKESKMDETDDEESKDKNTFNMWHQRFKYTPLEAERFRLAATPMTIEQRNRALELVSLAIYTMGLRPTPHDIVDRERQTEKRIKAKEKEDNKMTLLRACHNHNVDAVHTILESKGDPNQVKQVRKGEQHPVFASVYYSANDKSDLKVLQVLIDAKADVNIGDGSGDTPLHRCIQSGQFEKVRMLVHAKANLTKPCYGQTHLQHAEAQARYYKYSQEYRNVYDFLRFYK